MSLNGSLVLRKMKKQGMVALPMVVVIFSQYLLQVISLMMGGHLGNLPLSSAAIASSGLTGFIVLLFTFLKQLGMASALETLCGEAYGAEQYERLGIYTQRAVITFLIVCIPTVARIMWLENPRVFFAVLEAAIVVTTLFCTSYLLDRAYSSEKEVILYVARMIPLLSLASCMDAFQGVLSGVARGRGAYINLGAFYLFGIPIAALLAFSFHMGARGLWMGIVCGSVLQTILLSLITWFTDWQVEVNRARERILQNTL